MQNYNYNVYSFKDRCAMPIGLEDGRITEGQFSASSYYTSYLSPRYGRINFDYGWRPRQRNRHQWLQVDLGDIITIKGIATQGSRRYNYWAKSYRVSYSNDGIGWRWFRNAKRGVKVNEFISLWNQ
jgi:hypothetical protein